MSIFIDKLNLVSQAMPQPMGFMTGPVLERPRILLIASLAQGNIDDLADRVSGADAGLLRVTKSSSIVRTFQKASQAASDIPWGGWLEDIGDREIEQVAKVGCDFVIFPANTPLAIPTDDKVGKILEVEATLSEGLLRAVNELPVDAVLIAVEQKGEALLTWQHLMYFQRYADLLTKPLVVFIPSNVSNNELQAIWKAGVNGVVFAVEAEQPMGRLEELRQTIDKLVFPSRRRQKKAEALLPFTTSREEPDVATEEE